MVAYAPALASNEGPPRSFVTGLAHWLRAHRSSIAVAGLLSFAGPTTFFVGNLSVETAPTLSVVTALAFWFAVYGALLWCLLLVFGYVLVRLGPGRWPARAALTVVLATVAVLVADMSTAAGRTSINLEQGVVASPLTMHLYSATFALTMSLLFFAHLASSRTHEAAAARLAAAQAAHLASRRRAAQMRLQALQARVEPQLLFDMLEAVRQCYQNDALRAERLLDQLIAFLRAALPRLRSTSSSVMCESELARAYVRLRAMAGAADVDITLDVSAETMDARFPPGVLLPLVDDALKTRLGTCSLTATRVRDECRVALALPARPSDAALDRVRALLLDLYGAVAALGTETTAAVTIATITVPHDRV